MNSEGIRGEEKLMVEIDFCPHPYTNGIAGNIQI